MREGGKIGRKSILTVLNTSKDFSLIHTKMFWLTESERREMKNEKKGSVELANDKAHTENGMIENRFSFSSLFISRLSSTQQIVNLW